MWAPVGQQPQVPAPGQNQKLTVYGGVDYATGSITYTVSKTKSGTQFLNFLQELVQRYAGRKVRLVCDNARFHHTKAVHAWLEEHKHKLEIYWLPPYSPTLNLIERLWGHLKRTVLANVMYKELKDLLNAFQRGIAEINGQRSKMDFIYFRDSYSLKIA